MSDNYETVIADNVPVDEILARGAVVKKFESGQGSLYWNVNHTKKQGYRHPNHIIFDRGRILHADIDVPVDEPTVARHVTVNELTAFALAAKRDLPEDELALALVQFTEKTLEHRLQQISQALGQLSSEHVSA